MRFLLSTPVASSFGIAFINDSRSWSRKSYMVLSTLAYSKSCWMFCTGFARYLTTVPVALDVPPVIVSPVWNCCWPDMNNLGLVECPKSSTRIVAVAFDVAPVMVSPTTNLPVVASVPFSRTILLLSTSKANDSVSSSKSKLSMLTVTRNSPASRY